jgi:anti-sigma factor RsiW
MNHRDVREKLSAYIDGEVVDSEKEAIERHLQVCDACREALDALQQTVRQVKTLEEKTPPDGLTRRIMDRVRAEAADREQPFWHRLFFPLHIKLPIEAVAMVFLVVIGTYLYRQMPDDPRLAQAPSAVEQKSEAPSMADAEGENRRKGIAEERRSGAERPAAGYRAVRPAPALPEETGQESPAGRPAQPSPSLAFDESGPQRSGADRSAASGPSVLKQEVGPDLPSLQMTLEVDDPGSAAAAVEEHLKKAGGKLLHTETRSGDTVLTVRIPYAGLDSFRTRLAELGRVRKKEAALAENRTESVLRITLTAEPSSE